MVDFIRSRLRSFKHAFAGWWFVIRTQRNAWIHAVVSVGAFVLGLWLRLPPRDWAMIVFAAALVWTAEFVNTALEAVVDLHSPGNHPLAKVGKDVGAAAVLIAALAALLIGLLVLGPPMAEKIRPIFGF